MFVSISCEDRLRNDLYCVGWGVKLYSNQTKPTVSVRRSGSVSPSSARRAGGARACSLAVADAARNRVKSAATHIAKAGVVVTNVLGCHRGGRIQRLHPAQRSAARARQREINKEGNAATARAAQRRAACGCWRGHRSVSPPGLPPLAIHAFKRQLTV